MRYEGVTEWVDSPLLVYGAACKYFLHPEFRTSKEELHSEPGIYTGPPFNSGSPIHCSVWNKRYRDVDLGCVNVDDRVVVARSHRTHPSHQPYNQTVPVVDVAPDASVWYDSRTEAHPADVAGRPAALGEGGADPELLPSYAGPIWLSHSPVATARFSVGTGSGAARPGDIAGWLYMLSGGSHVHVRIDKKIGGYEHRLDRADIHQSICLLLAHERCDGLIMQLTCGPWSSIKFETTGQGVRPQPIFLQSAPDGVRAQDGTLAHGVQAAMAMVDRGVEHARVVLARGKLLISEHPMTCGAGSLLATRGLEEHSGMHDTTPFRRLKEEFGLVSVFTDQGASGHPKRKATDLLCDEVTARAVREQLGTRAVAEDWVSGTPPLIGKDEHGVYRTRAAETYAALFCERMGRAVVHRLSTSSSTAGAAVVEGGASSGAGTTAVKLNPEITVVEPEPHVQEAEGLSNPYASGERVEVFFEEKVTSDSAWYAGTVVDIGTSRARIKGRMVSVPDITVRYDDTPNETRVHALHNNLVRPATVPGLHAILADRFDARGDDQKQYADHMSAVLSSLQSRAPGIGSEKVVQLQDDALCPHAGEVLALCDVHIDLETGDVLNTSSLFVVDHDGKLLRAASLDKVHARYWHTPSNEREYMMSPQRALWLTAKELKWDEYMKLDMFEWVALSDVDQKVHRIYATLWAYKIKFGEGLVFQKLNPRWCFKGGTMDRGIYKAHAETLRMTSYKCIGALKAGYWKAFAEFLIDCSNAFQATRTDGRGAEDGLQLPASAPIHCWPAPGFERRTTAGERMVCKVNVGMQGRIDATRLFNTNLFRILLQRAHMTRLVWDKQVAVFHNGPGIGTVMSLSEVLVAIRDATDTAAQDEPIGYAVVGFHVDDGLGVACSVGWDRDYKSNRVIQFIVGKIEVTYACTLTGWHGNKSLGYTLTLDEARHVVNMSAMDALKRLADELLKGMHAIAPKHIMGSDIGDIPEGEIPVEGDPSRESVLTEMALTRHALGVFIWATAVHVEGQYTTNTLCGRMHRPHARTLKASRFQLMHLISHSPGTSFGGDPSAFGLEQPDKFSTDDPYGKRPMHAVWFADASLDGSSRSGGVCMLARGCVMGLSQRQHLASPCSHSSEVVSAGTNFSLAVPVIGVMQELRIQLGKPVPFYLDSKTTVFVASSDSAVKKSVWLIRRVVVIEEGVMNDYIQPVHITERDMAADPFTKYLTHGVWSRHMHFVLNKAGPVPPYPGKG